MKLCVTCSKFKRFTPNYWWSQVGIGWTCQIQKMMWDLERTKLSEILGWNSSKDGGTIQSMACQTLELGKKMAGCSCAKTAEYTLNLDKPTNTVKNIKADLVKRNGMKSSKFANQTNTNAWQMCAILGMHFAHGNLALTNATDASFRDGCSVSNEHWLLNEMGMYQRIDKSTNLCTMRGLGGWETRFHMLPHLRRWQDALQTRTLWHCWCGARTLIANWAQETHWTSIYTEISQIQSFKNEMYNGECGTLWLLLCMSLTNTKNQNDGLFFCVFFNWPELIRDKRIVSYNELETEWNEMCVCVCVYCVFANFVRILFFGGF